MNKQKKPVTSSALLQQVYSTALRYLHKEEQKEAVSSLSKLESDLNKS